MTKAPSIIQSAIVAKLSPELTKEYSVHSMPLRKGDTITVVRGAFRDVEGKITRADHKNISIYVEGITREKSDGSTIFLPIYPSNVMLTKLNLDDKWRKKILGRKASKSVVETQTEPKTRARKRQPNRVSSKINKNKKEE